MDASNQVSRTGFQLFHSLKNPVFFRLYTAQTTSLLGDALTWVGLALLAFDLGNSNSPIVLSASLSLRVAAFVLFAPLAGAIADRFDRKLILTLSHLARMVIVGLLPFATTVWHVYGLIFALNVFNAFFTPTYRATIPLVTGEEDYPQAIALSNATGQLLGVLGPGIAGGVAALLGMRQIFWLDAASFLIAAVLIVTLPGQLMVQDAAVGTTWQDIQTGTRRLMAVRSLRYALGMQFVAAIAGAQILVNTVGYVKGTLHLGDPQYGWVMAAFGTGATLAAAAVGSLTQDRQRLMAIGLGAVLITVALIPANFAGLWLLMVLWLLAGIGESWINVPTQTLIAERIPTEFQGRVYGAHFAWSHLWWLFAYPMAGWLGSAPFIHHSFLVGSVLGFLSLAIVALMVVPGIQHESVES